MGQYFTIKELCKSDTANLKGIDNTPSYEIENNLNHLINELLDPIRQLYGNPIYINSGYRCRALNEAVKGSKTSQHMDGLAADLDTRDFSENVRLFNLIQSSGLPFDQLINESNYSWVHVSYRPDGQNRYQILHL
jgi:uncharacterized protein YcbK (DUF882 family)